MSVIKYKDPHTGEVKKVGSPKMDVYDKSKVNELLDTKAPAGFGGFGEVLSYVSPGNDDTDGSKFDALIEAEFLNMSNNQTIQLRFDCYPYLSGSVFFGTLWKSSANYGILTGWSYSGEIVIKCKKAGTWYPFERVNTMTQVNSAIQTAIGDAIGGSY